MQAGFSIPSDRFMPHGSEATSGAAGFGSVESSPFVAVAAAQAGAGTSMPVDGMVHDTVAAVVGAQFHPASVPAGPAAPLDRMAPASPLPHPLASDRQAAAAGPLAVPVSQVDFGAWLADQHQAGHPGFAGVGGLGGIDRPALGSSVDTLPLPRQRGADAGSSRPNAAPFASLGHDRGPIGVTEGASAPPPGQTGSTLAGVADQAAAGAAGDDASLAAATTRAGRAATTGADIPTAAAAGSNLSAEPAGPPPAITMTTVSFDPQDPNNLAATTARHQATHTGTHTWTAPAPSGGDRLPAAPAHHDLADHVSAAPVHVLDPYTFTDDDSASDFFTLHADGSDATGLDDGTADYAYDQSTGTPGDGSTAHADAADHFRSLETGDDTITSAGVDGHRSLARTDTGADHTSRTVDRSGGGTGPGSAFAGGDSFGPAGPSAGSDTGPAGGSASLGLSGSYHGG